MLPNINGERRQQIIFTDHDIGAYRFRRGHCSVNADRACGVDANFAVTFHDRLFVAPAGGAGESVDISVRPK